VAKFLVSVREQVKDYIYNEYEIEAENEDEVKEIFGTQDFWKKAKWRETLDRDYEDETTGYWFLDEIYTEGDK
jgi:hypothetical protein